jgi:hypothetical protein
LCANLARGQQAPVNTPRKSGPQAESAYVPGRFRTLDIERTQAEQCGKADSSAIRSGFALNLNPSEANRLPLVHQWLGEAAKTLIVSTA